MCKSDVCSTASLLKDISYTMVAPMFTVMEVDWILAYCQTYEYDGEHERVKISASVLHAEKTNMSGSHWADSTVVKVD